MAAQGCAGRRPTAQLGPGRGKEAPHWLSLIAEPIRSEPRGHRVGGVGVGGGVVTAKRAFEVSALGGTAWRCSTSWGREGIASQCYVSLLKIPTFSIMHVTHDIKPAAT